MSGSSASPVPLLECDLTVVDTQTNICCDSHLHSYGTLVTHRNIYIVRTCVHVCMYACWYIRKNKVNIPGQDFPAGSVVKTLSSNAGSVGSIPGHGDKIPNTSRPKNQNTKQKQYCNKFNKVFINDLNEKNLKKKSQGSAFTEISSNVGPEPYLKYIYICYRLNVCTPSLIPVSWYLAVPLEDD